MLDKVFAAMKLPVPVREYRFSPPRRWKMDYAWPNQKIALEVEGGIWTKGRHTRGQGFLDDIEKYNAAGSLGWRVFRTTPKDLLKTATIEMLKTVLTQQTK